MNLAGLLKGKQTLMIGGVAALGVGVLFAMRRNGSSTAAGQPIQPAQLDTSSSDMSQALNTAQESWAADLREFSGSLGTILDRLGEHPQGTPPVTGTDVGVIQIGRRRQGPGRQPPATGGVVGPLRELAQRARR